MAGSNSIIAKYQGSRKFIVEQLLGRIWNSRLS